MSTTRIVRAHPMAHPLRDNLSFLIEKKEELIIAVAVAAICALKFSYSSIPLALSAAYIGTLLSKNLSLFQNTFLIAAIQIVVNTKCWNEPDFL